MDKKTVSKRGRKPKNVKFPVNRKFTLKGVAASLAGLKRPISTVALSNKIKVLVNEGKAEVVGKVVNGKGRPMIQYFIRK